MKNNIYRYPEMKGKLEVEDEDLIEGVTEVVVIEEEAIDLRFNVIRVTL